MTASASDSARTAPLLSGLPTFGTLTGDRLVVPEAGITNYVPHGDTTPPPDQVLHSDTQNALVRALIAKRQRDEKREKKRQADEAAIERVPAKRAAVGGGGSGSCDAQNQLAAELRSLTNPQLKHRLQVLGLQVSGKKEDLIDRLLAAQHRSSLAASGGDGGR